VRERRRTRAGGEREGGGDGEQQSEARRSHGVLPFRS
jgi:hypothetical protein